MRTTVKKAMILCPGQGAQYIGMFRKAVKSPKLQNLLKSASGILGYDVQTLADCGEKHILDRTLYCQPTIVLSTILAFENLREEFKKEELSLKVHSIAGYSVGELSGLYISRRISFTDVINLVAVRARAMQRACEQQATGMVSMQGLSFQEADELCSDISQSHTDERHFVQIAIRQYPVGVLLGGSLPLLNRIIERKHTLIQDLNKVKLSKIPVNGAFHTKYMAPAESEFAEMLSRVNLRTNDVSPMYCNQTGLLYGTGIEDGLGDEIRENLVRQISDYLRWYPIMQNVFIDFDEGNFTDLYELGPGKNLKMIAGNDSRLCLSENIKINSNYLLMNFHGLKYHYHHHC